MCEREGREANVYRSSIAQTAYERIAIGKSRDRAVVEILKMIKPSIKMEHVPNIVKKMEIFAEAVDADHVAVWIVDRLMSLHWATFAADYFAEMFSDHPDAYAMHALLMISAKIVTRVRDRAVAEELLFHAVGLFKTNVDEFAEVLSSFGHIVGLTLRQTGKRAAALAIVDVLNARPTLSVDATHARDITDLLSWMGANNIVEHIDLFEENIWSVVPEGILDMFKATDGVLDAITTWVQALFQALPAGGASLPSAAMAVFEIVRNIGFITGNIPSQLKKLGGQRVADSHVKAMEDIICGFQKRVIPPTIYLHVDTASLQARKDLKQEDVGINVALVDTSDARTFTVKTDIECVNAFKQAEKQETSSQT